MSDSFCLGKTLPLGTRKIDDLQLADDGVVRVTREHLLNCDGKDGVGTRRGHVHFVAAHRLVLDSVVIQMENFVDILTLYIHQVLHCVDVVLIPL